MGLVVALFSLACDKMPKKQNSGDSKAEWYGRELEEFFQVFIAFFCVTNSIPRELGSKHQLINKKPRSPNVVRIHSEQRPYGVVCKNQNADQTTFILQHHFTSANLFPRKDSTISFPINSLSSYHFTFINRFFSQRFHSDLSNQLECAQGSVLYSIDYCQCWT